MTRKDSEKDADRPHYYSQFWLDIAAGRRVIGGPKPEEAEAGEAEVLEPAPTRKAGRASATDGYKETRASAVVEPPEEEEEEFTQEEIIDEDELPDIPLEEEVAPLEEEFEEDYSEEEPEEEDFYDEEDEEEDEEWGRRGRKKAKPTRPSKPVKKPRRETRRGF